MFKAKWFNIWKKNRFFERIRKFVQKQMNQRRTEYRIYATNHYSDAKPLHYNNSVRFLPFHLLLFGLMCGVWCALALWIEYIGSISIHLARKPNIDRALCSIERRLRNNKIYLLFLLFARTIDASLRTRQMIGTNKKYLLCLICCTFFPLSPDLFVWLSFWWQCI